MNAAIQLKANEINSVVSTKVGNNEVISRINQSSEQIAISASKIALEGYTTINGGFAIDTNGNASIANGAVVIDNTGIKMADNTQIIGGNGLMSNLQFVGKSLNYNANNLFGQYWFWNSATSSFEFKSDYIIIDANIPSNFTIVDAKITLTEHPIRWSNYPVYGYVREVGLYQVDSTSKLEVSYATTQNMYDSFTNVISNCWGTSKTTTWTPRNASDSNYGMQTVNSINLKNILDSDSKCSFAIKSVHNETYSESTAEKRAAQNTCLVTAVLNVYGFMAF